MDRLALWFREYPMVAGIGLALLLGLVVGGLIGTLMSRSGLSLKPLVFFFVFLAIVGGPQAVIHALDAVAFHRRAAAIPATSAPVAVPPAEAAPPTSSIGPVPWDRVFGPNADPSLMVDPRIGLGAILSGADDGKLSFNTQGESALAARFPSEAAAAQALERYFTFFQFGDLTGNDTVGWTGRRYQGQGEWNHVVRAGRELYAWTGASRLSVVTRRESVLGALGAAGNAPAAPVSGPGSSSGGGATRAVRAHEARLVSGRIASKPSILIPFVGINLLVAVLWFFKGSAWAARVPGASGTRPQSAAEVQSRLAALGTPESPVTVTASDDGREIELHWRWADARWRDWMRQHRRVRVHRLVLRLDPATSTVRVREYMTAMDASAGLDGVRLTWMRATGIQFFQWERQTVFGAQLDAAGRWTGDWSRVSAFDLQALKAPAIGVVTQSGWTWQPVLVDGPSWLRWLTE